MNTQSLTPELTDEENELYNQSAEKLAEKYSVSKVHPIVLIHPETLVRSVCFLKEPNYETKLRVMDKAVSIGIFVAADELRQACILKEESDSITYGEGIESVDYKLGVTNFALGLVNGMHNHFKKK